MGFRQRMLYLKTIRSEISKRAIPEEWSDATGLVVIIKVYLPYSFLTNAVKKQTAGNLTDSSKLYLLHLLVTEDQFPCKVSCTELKVTYNINCSLHVAEPIQQGASCFAALGLQITFHAVLVCQLISQLIQPIFSFRNQEPHSPRLAHSFYCSV